MASRFTRSETNRSPCDDERDGVSGGRPLRLRRADSRRDADRHDRILLAGRDAANPNGAGVHGVFGRRVRQAGPARFPGSSRAISDRPGDGEESRVRDDCPTKPASGNFGFGPAGDLIAQEAWISLPFSVGGFIIKRLCSSSHPSGMYLERARDRQTGVVAGPIDRDGTRHGGGILSQAGAVRVAENERLRVTWDSIRDWAKRTPSIRACGMSDLGTGEVALDIDAFIVHLHRGRRRRGAWARRTCVQGRRGVRSRRSCVRDRRTRRSRLEKAHPWARRRRP